MPHTGPAPDRASWGQHHVPAYRGANRGVVREGGERMVWKRQPAVDLGISAPKPGLRQFLLLLLGLRRISWRHIVGENYIMKNDKDWKAVQRLSSFQKLNLKGINTRAYLRMERTASLVASMLIKISCLVSADLMLMLLLGGSPWCLAWEGRQQVIFLSPLLENHIPVLPNSP